MENKRVEPIKPEDVKAMKSEENEKTIASLIQIVNAILTTPTSVATLKSGRRVEVYDSSHSEDWDYYHLIVMARFEQVGWIVDSFKPAHYYVGFVDGE